MTLNYVKYIKIIVDENCEEISFNDINIGDNDDTQFSVRSIENLVKLVRQQEYEVDVDNYGFDVELLNVKQLIEFISVVSRQRLFSGVGSKLVSRDAVVGHNLDLPVNVTHSDVSCTYAHMSCVQRY